MNILNNLFKGKLFGNKKNQFDDSKTNKANINEQTNLDKHDVKPLNSIIQHQQNKDPINDKYLNQNQTEAKPSDDTESESHTRGNSINADVGDKYISVGNPNADDSKLYKVIRELNDNQIQTLKHATLGLRSAQLFMHYWKDDIDGSNRQDPEWQNMIMFFWRAEEPFPKKSLPAYFDNLIVKHFLFEKQQPGYSLTVSQAIPWFDQPGGGDKYVCVKNSKAGKEMLTVPELHDLGIVEYYEAVTLDDNLDILTDVEQYMFLIDERMIRFQNGRLYLEDKLIPLHVAYAIGAIHVIKKSKL